MDLLGLLPALAFVLLFALLPLMFLAGDALGQLRTLRQVLAIVLRNPAARLVLFNSFEQGTLSALLAFVWGFPVGVFLGRRSFPGRDLLLALLLVPFLLPVLVVVLGVEELFGPQGVISSLWPATQGLSTGLAGILFVNLYFNTSVVALFTVSGVEASSVRLEQAVAVLGGGPWRTFRDVWGGRALLGGAAGALLTFLFSFLSFAPPLLLGRWFLDWTVEDEIYQLWYHGALVPSVALAFWVMVLLLLPSVLYLLVARRVRLLSVGDTSTRRRGGTRRWDWRSLPFLFATVALVGTVFLLLSTVLVESFVELPNHVLGLENWRSLLSPQATGALGVSTGTALLNSVFFAVASTLMVLLVGIALGFTSRRHRTASGAVTLLTFVPMIASPIILALALWSFFQGTLYTQSLDWVLVLGAQAALALPFVLQTLIHAFRSQSPRPREAAMTLGAHRLRAFLDADVVGSRSALILGGLFTFSLSLGEFAATNFLYIPAYATMVVEMYVLLGVKMVGAAAALAALLVLVSLTSFFLILVVGRRVRR
ncbi:MAG: iron ABC transporter permease [Euryarchaeota archaeon]|nr:iron ABC transporter permease [Euryarchaeota archaeon]MDE2045837.1 iron ABC transporter permease [Thermoplasmata archaeon]